MRFSKKKGRTLRERFDEKWIPDPSGCWLWLGVKTGNGYGQLRDDRMRPAHVIAYELHVW